MFVLDSTVLIDYLRGRPVVERVTTLLQRGQVLTTTVINVEEVVRGLRPLEERAARSLFDGLNALPIDAAGAWLAGEWRRESALRGRTLPQADCLIAAVTVLAGASLATGNPADFSDLPVSIEHWQVGA